MVFYETIESPEDPRVADFRITREPELVKNRGIFIAESPFVVKTLIQRSRYPVRSVLLGSHRVESLEPMLEGLSEEVPVYVAESAVMDSIAGFHIHRSCLASGERGELPPMENLVASTKASTLVALESVSNHDNTGGIFRNASAFGVGAVLLDRHSADPLYRKAIRVSIASTLTVPFARGATSVEMMGRLRQAGFESWALTPRGEDDLEEIAPKTPSDPRRIVLWLGAEGPGMTDEALATADRRVRIPMAPGPDALNVAATSAIALYILSRRSR